MSQKDKIQQVVREHEFEFTTPSGPAAVFAVLESGAEVAAVGHAKGSIAPGSRSFRLLKKSLSDTHLETVWQLVHTTIMGSASMCTFSVNVEPAEGNRFRVALQIGEYGWVKGSMFAAPSLTASFWLRKLESFLKQELVK